MAARMLAFGLLAPASGTGAVRTERNERTRASARGTAAWVTRAGGERDAMKTETDPAAVTVTSGGPDSLPTQGDAAVVGSYLTVFIRSWVCEGGGRGGRGGRGSGGPPRPSPAFAHRSSLVARLQGSIRSTTSTSSCRTFSARGITRITWRNSWRSRTSTRRALDSSARGTCRSRTSSSSRCSRTPWC